MFVAVHSQVLFNTPLFLFDFADWSGLTVYTMIVGDTLPLPFRGRSLQLLRYRTVEDHPLRSFGPGSLKTLLPRGNGKQARCWKRQVAFVFGDVYGSLWDM